MVSLTINGKTQQFDVPDDMPLLWVIRDLAGLTGTKFGCGMAQCGACTVHVDGKSVKSCNVLALQANGAQITTIEGLAKNGTLHPMQEAFRDNHGLQCGFCTPGMVMAAVSLAKDTPNLTEDQIRHGLDGNICRCTGYHNIVKAVKAGAQAMAGGK